MKKKIFLSVVIPCYNEEKNLKRGVLGEVDRYLGRQNYQSEVIISDDGSTDKSLEFVTDFCRSHPGFRLLKNPHGGKVFALKSGVEAAAGEIVLTTDMDQSAPIAELEKLLPFFKKGYQVVIGSRGQERKGFSVLRKVGSAVFRFFRQKFLLKDIIDTQCGFKTYRSQVAKDLFPRLLVFKKVRQVKGWRVGAFDVELLFIAQKKGYKISEVTVKWKDEDITKGKQRKYFKESRQMLKEILRVKLNDLRGYYD